MILAGIDIGTNTLRLLVADLGPGFFHQLHSDRRITRLGQDLDRTGVLSPDAQDRSLAALAEFSESLRSYPVCAVSAVGTSALRNASNSAEFIKAAKKRTGLDVRVIPGEEEARLTLLGVAGALQGVAHERIENALTSALVIDIGGGSTELIVTGCGEKTAEVSLPLGAVYLTERFVRHDPPSSGDLEGLRAAVRGELNSLSAELLHEKPLLFAGTAGTITTLAALDQELMEYDPGRINRSTLTRRSVDRIIRQLSASTLQERRNFPGLEPGREDIILAGAIVVQELMERFGYAAMLVSDWGLREGVLFDLYGKKGVSPRAKTR